MNQVAEKKNSALATFDMEADAQQGTQNISQEDQIGRAHVRTPVTRGSRMPSSA